MEKITCQTCGSQYDPIEFVGETSVQQAYGCAADVDVDLIVGAYGSTVVDWDQAFFVGDPPKAVKNGLICDTCLRNLMKAGFIE